MSETKFVVGRTYRTRGGGTATCEWTDGKTVLFRHESGVRMHYASGTFFGDKRCQESGWDVLPPAPPKPVRVRRWLNLYRSELGFLHPTKPRADENRAGYNDPHKWLGCVPVILEIPADIAGQCEWLKDAEIVEDAS